MVFVWDPEAGTPDGTPEEPLSLQVGFLPTQGRLFCTNQAADPGHTSIRRPEFPATQGSFDVLIALLRKMVQAD